MELSILAEVPMDLLEELRTKAVKAKYLVVMGDRRNEIALMAFPSYTTVYAARLHEIPSDLVGEVLLVDFAMLTRPFTSPFDARGILSRLDRAVVTTKRELLLPAPSEVVDLGRGEVDEDLGFRRAVELGLPRSEVGRFRRIVRYLKMALSLDPSYSKESMYRIYRSEGGRAGRVAFEMYLLILAYSGLLPYPKR